MASKRKKKERQEEDVEQDASIDWVSMASDSVKPEEYEPVAS